ncbi:MULTISPECIES: dTMP kinase [Trichocoleus]|uniref:Thymidylate kinase n=1 Tax=Trichocoleus desertorum GB2-A4 TaxID=2933944 RepID=A0ABV0J5Z0_9CYAN|nr:dTMP kinase [Trichocoleus sp. FACHB-46]MBD1863308.1 dTMP kinase [Trichocoleus sp. FACHB-46]
MQGRLIVFEGVEGSGKTTQMLRSQAWLLENQCFQSLKEDLAPPILVTREPGGTELGLELRQLLLGYQGQEAIQNRAELLLYAADRAQHVDGYLKPQLARGAVILCDRYTDSTIAYQGYGRGLDLALIDQLNQAATGGLESDLTLWLDVDAELGLARMRQRGKADRIEQADLAFHQRVQQGFQALHQQYPERIVRIDASQSEQRVAHQIQQVLSQRLTQWYQPLLHP